MGKILTVKMPDIGEGVVEGEVIEWLKKVDDNIKQDEPVVVVMTDKATVELPAPRPGKLAKVYFQTGQIATKDHPLYDIELQNEAAETSLPNEQIEKLSEAEKLSKKEKNPTQCSHAISTPIKARQGKVLTTPPIRHIASLLDIDLRTIKGTGKDGRITLEDLKSRKSTETSVVPIAVEEGDEERSLVGVRRLMAEKMKASKFHIPHFSYFEKVDATRLMALREKMKEHAAHEDIHVTFMPLFIRALSLCIGKYPEINSSFEESGNKVIIHKHQNIGVAVAGPQGLVVAVMHDVQKMNLDQIIHVYDVLKKRSIAGQLSPSDMKNSTITISNFGVLGGSGLWATPIINYPEAAILAVDRIQKQPVVVNNEVVVRSVLNVSWSFDHRFLDGEIAAAVSKCFCANIKDPGALL